MKKQRKRPQGKTKRTPQATASEAKPIDRRAALRLLRNGAIALPVLGVAGYFSIGYVQASICELDLSKIGNGTPAIVQIHDQNCSLCRTLQRQSRQALRAFDDERFEYLVANIDTAEGAALAAQHGVQHVTLLLFDGAGDMIQIVRGPTTAEDLGAIFAAHLDRFS